MKSYIFPLAFLAASTSANVYEEIILSGPFDEEVVPAGNSQPGMKVSWYPAKITGESEALGQYQLDLLILSGTVGLAPDSLSQGQEIMQYFTHEDSANPGKYATWTCSMQFDSASSYASKDSITIKNYYGGESWSEEELTSF